MEDIESEMEAQSVIMNYDSSLFIANKIDFVPEDDRKDLKDEIVSKLREKWPLVDKYNVIEMQASQVIKWHVYVFQYTLGYFHFSTDEHLFL